MNVLKQLFVVTWVSRMQVVGRLTFLDQADDDSGILLC
jgi:hypothetical protein